MKSVRLSLGSGYFSHRRCFRDLMCVCKAERDGSKLSPCLPGCLACPVSSVRPGSPSCIDTQSRRPKTAPFVIYWRRAPSND